MKYRELYEYGEMTLSGAGIAEAQLDARLLLEHVCGTNRNDMLVHGDRDIADCEKECYVTYIERRKAHEPLQHITGEQDFMGLTFQVNEHVLIPRQDTEILVEEVMRYLHDGMSILDMCTGSGCILLSLLHYSNDCSGVGADISETALEIAQKNKEELQIQGAEFVKSDLFEAISGKYDLIVSNPPYIPTEVIPTLMEEVRSHEPVGALDGRKDGLFFYRKIIEQASVFLTRGGILFFEIGCEQAESVKAMLETAGYKEINVVKDYAGLDRVVYGFLV